MNVLHDFATTLRSFTAGALHADGRPLGHHVLAQ